MKWTALLLLTVVGFMSCQAQNNSSNKLVKDSMSKKDNPYFAKGEKGILTVKDSEWKKVLSPEVYTIAREKGTERPWTSKFENYKEVGTYYCAVCGNGLFKSDTKFDSGCGWPSFYEPLTKAAIIYLPDNTHGMQRTEVQCGRCKSHLGHVFEDGPPPTGLRFCINGVVLDFEKAAEAAKKYNEKKG